MPSYRDIRSRQWRAWFEAAQSYEAYLAASPPDKAARWRGAEEKLPALETEARGRLQGFGRELNLLLVSGVWCGDCVRQGPMIRQLVDACDDGVSLRVIDRDAIPALRDEVRILGAERVPVLVFLSEDFFEVGRFGDRMLARYRRKAQNEFGAACPVPSALIPEDELREERDEWLDILERMLLMVRLAPSLRQRHQD